VRERGAMHKIRAPDPGLDGRAESAFAAPKEFAAALNTAD
jgi:hypothetical protein